MKNSLIFGLATLAIASFMLLNASPASSAQEDSMESGCSTIWADTYAICSNAPSQGPLLDCMNEALCVMVAEFALCDCLYSNDPAAAVACSTSAQNQKAAAFAECRANCLWDIPFAPGISETSAKWFDKLLRKRSLRVREFPSLNSSLGIFWSMGFHFCFSADSDRDLRPVRSRST